MLSQRKVWMNGKLVPMSKAQVHIMSHSFARGSAVFEVMSVHETSRGPALFRLDDHIQRAFGSAELSRMKLPLSARRFREAIKAAVRANRVGSGMVKLICYYPGIEFEVIPRRPEVSVAVVAVDLTRDLDAERFIKEERTPAQVTVSRWRKIDPRTVPVQCKCAANYLGGMIAKMDAIRHGFTAPVLLDLKGYLAEGATESLFMVKNRVLKTPALGNILAGITRKTVLELARDVGIKTVEKRIRPQELLEADEAFFTSSVVKLWPISRVEKQTLNAPGEITRLLDRALTRICAGKVKSYNQWLTPVNK